MHHLILAENNNITYNNILTRSCFQKKILPLAFCICASQKVEWKIDPGIKREWGRVDHEMKQWFQNGYRRAFIVLHKKVVLV